MGTFGPGPLDSDNALDLVDGLPHVSSPPLRGNRIMTELRTLCSYDPSHTKPYIDRDLLTDFQLGVAACTVVAMQVAHARGQYPYIYGYCPSDPPEEGEFHVGLLWPVPLPMLSAATSAIAVARALVDHPDMPNWNTNDEKEAHRKALADLEAVLTAEAARTPGHPLYVPTGTEVGVAAPAQVPVLRITTRAQLAQLMRELGASADGHENDQYGITATVHGLSFDTSGFWPLSEVGFTGMAHTKQGLPREVAAPTPPHAEMYVTLLKDGTPRGQVNLAQLVAWAAEPEADSHG